MRGNQPGNIIGYSVITPLLPALINFKDTAGLHLGVRMGKINTFKVGFYIVIEVSRFPLSENTYKPPALTIWLAILY
jgi:hypothetical protein